MSRYELAIFSSKPSPLWKYYAMAWKRWRVVSGQPTSLPSQPRWDTFWKKVATIGREGRDVGEGQRQVSSSVFFLKETDDDTHRRRRLFVCPPKASVSKRSFAEKKVLIAGIFLGPAILSFLSWRPHERLVREDLFCWPKAMVLALPVIAGN